MLIINLLYAYDYFCPNFFSFQQESSRVKLQESNKMIRKQIIQLSRLINLDRQQFAEIK